MSATAQGLFFLQKAKPLATRAANGEFALRLFAVDRIGSLQVEPWELLVPGELGEAFWARHQAQLVPGAAVRASVDRIRSHSHPRGSVIHGVAIAIEFVSAPSSAHAAAGNAPSLRQPAAA